MLLRLSEMVGAFLVLVSETESKESVDCGPYARIARAETATGTVDVITVVHMINNTRSGWE